LLQSPPHMPLLPQRSSLDYLADFHRKNRLPRQNQTPCGPLPVSRVSIADSTSLSTNLNCQLKAPNAWTRRPSTTSCPCNIWFRTHWALSQMSPIFRRIWTCSLRWPRSWKTSRHASLRRVLSISLVFVPRIQVHANLQRWLKIWARTCLFSSERWHHWLRSCKTSHQMTGTTSRSKWGSSAPPEAPGPELLSTSTQLVKKRRPTTTTTIQTTTTDRVNQSVIIFLTN
jgi:hypothetical protein